MTDTSTATPGFWRITLDTNPDQCNLACVMCEDHSPHAKREERRRAGLLRPRMPRDLMERTLHEAAAMGIVEVIPSTMGEPLLYPHFDAMLTLCHELGLRLNLTTNGTFPAPRGIDGATVWGERVLPIASDVKISWNGATGATQRAIMGSNLPRQVDNTRRFLEVRDGLDRPDPPTVTMQMTFMRRNLDEIAHMVRLAASLGFDRVKGHQLWAHFEQLGGEDLRSSPELAARWNAVVEECQAIVSAHNESGGRPLRLDNFHPLAPADARTAVGCCPFLGREIWIDSSGRFNVCCAPDRERRTLGEFGSVAETPLSDLVESEAYRELLHDWRDRPLCRGCSMRRPDV